MLFKISEKGDKIKSCLKAAMVWLLEDFSIWKTDNWSKKTLKCDV